MLHEIYPVVITRQSNPPISQFSRPLVNVPIQYQSSTMLNPA